MSLILEALKKSERERQQKTAPGAATPAPEAAAGPSKRRRWVVIVAVLPVLAFAVGGVVGYLRLVPAPQPAARETAAPKPTAGPRPAARIPEPSAVAGPPTPTAQSAPVAIAAAPRPSVSEPQVAAPATATPAPREPATTVEAATAAAEPAVDALPAPLAGRLAGIAVPKKKPAAPFAAAAQPLGAGQAQALIRRGRAYDDKGLYEEAIAAYGEAIAIDPGFAEAFHGRGWARIAKGVFADAAQDFQRMIALRPDSADAYFGRAWALERLGDREQAIGHYGEAIRRQPGLADAYFSRGVLQFMAGRMEAAARDFAEVRQRAGGRLRDFALLWRYVSEARGGVNAPTVTFDDRSDEPWPGMLARLFRGEATPSQVLVAARHRDPTQQRENECIALFFLGQQRLIAGDATAAADYFRRTLATGVTYFRQYAAAEAELKRLESRN